MALHRARKQWSLTEDETITSFECWRQIQLYCLKSDKLFKDFLKPDVTWQKKTKANTNRGFTDTAGGLTAAEKAENLELMLEQLANYCTIISRKTIVDNSTSMGQIWQAIRVHFGFQASGAHFLDFSTIILEPNEKPETLYQRLLAFVEDNLLKKDGDITHEGEAVKEDEELTPSLHNYVVLHWLKLVHPELPSVVKTKYATELRSKTLASIKQEISLALPSLLDGIHSNQDAKSFRSTMSRYNRNDYESREHTKPQSYGKPLRKKECSLCKQAGRPASGHHIQNCRFLPENDRKYVTKARSADMCSDEEENSDHDDRSAQSRYVSSHDEVDMKEIESGARLVSIVESPFLDSFYKHHHVRLTIDSGATGTFINHSKAKEIGVPIRNPRQSAHQADGKSKLKIVGETYFEVVSHGHTLKVDALIAEDLDEDVLASSAFMSRNDVWTRPARGIVGIGDYKYSYDNKGHKKFTSARRIQAHIIRSPKSSTTVWPGEFVEVQLPKECNDEEYAIEPRTDSRINSKCTTLSDIWPPPFITHSIDNTIRIPNLSDSPIVLSKNDQFCQARAIHIDSNSYDGPIPPLPSPNILHTPSALPYHSNVTLNPDNIMPQSDNDKFKSLLNDFDHVFDPKIKGYNGAMGMIKAKVNMGPTLPPQRKGRLPQYNRDKLVELQTKFDELEELGVFRKPEDIDINVEYLNPSFLVRKSRGGNRLVTAFADIGRYSKPQPSLMPDVDSTLRCIAQWKYIIKTDLTKAFFQIPLEKSSMKYCGVVTPFKGVRVYVKAAMGMPGSETALEELMSRVTGDLLQEGCVAKIADNLFCGGNTIDELYDNWSRVLLALSKSNLRLSASQTVICPKSTDILGWVWSNGTLSASPHVITTLSTCSQPKTVKQLRSFIGAYKVLSRVIPKCSNALATLDNMVAGSSSSDELVWSDEKIQSFESAKSLLSSNKIIHLPRPEDQLWIVGDAAVRDPGISATLYVQRPESKKMLIGGFFSAKLKKNELDWQPCEREALCLSSATKHYQPYITQSIHHPCILTDNDPCVKAYEKLCRGDFSASPRLSTYLTVVSRFQASVRHIAGIDNALSDFGSRNPAECDSKSCQICSFISESEECVVRNISVQDVLDNKCKLPFMSRAAWLMTQSECPDLRRARAHLEQGTRPSKKVTNIRDVKRYLNNIHIANDRLLVVRNDEPMAYIRERIVIPRSVLDGLLNALHIKLDHPTCHQLKTVSHRYFYALDMDKAIERVSSGCHLCSSLQQVKHMKQLQSSSDPPVSVGSQFACDIIRRERQFIIILREVVTSFTSSSLITNEQQTTLRDNLLQLCIPLRPLDGPPTVVRVDSAPGWKALKNDECLRKHNITIELGREKNKNKNPVAEKGVEELELEILKQQPLPGPVSSLTLSLATARLNARIRSRGLSSREMFFQRDQVSNQQLPLDDMDLIEKQHTARLQNHPYSEKSKAPNREYPIPISVSVGDLVYLHSDRDKTMARDRYIVTAVDGEWLNIRKFVGRQLRSSSYRVKNTECYKVPSHTYPNYQSCPGGEDEDETNMNDQYDLVTPDNLTQSPINPCPDLSHDNNVNNDNLIVSDVVSSDPVVPPVPDIPEEIIPTKTCTQDNIPSSNGQNSHESPPVRSHESPPVRRSSRQCRKPDFYGITET